MKTPDECLREALEESPYGILTYETALEAARKYAAEYAAEAVQQRDELKEACYMALAELNAAGSAIHSITIEAIEAAIKKTEPKAEECSYWETYGYCIPGCGTDNCKRHPLNR